MPPHKKSSRVSLREIAAKANVSIGSVSSVLNNRQLERRIPPETAQKIRAVAAKLGYLPNINARRLRSGGGNQNNVVLALVTSFEAPVPLINYFINILHQEIQGKGKLRSDLSFSLMVEVFNAGRLKEMPGLLSGDHFNGAILLNTVAEDDQFLARTRLPYPAVLVNRLIPGYSSVMENLEGGARAAELLLKGRRSHPAIIYGSPLTQITQNRVNAFQRHSVAILGKAGHEIVADDLSGEGGYLAMKRFLGQANDPVDALYAVSDVFALGAYRAIRERGLKIPGDIAVIGVGDYEISRLFDPPLSCVGVSHENLAREAVHLLLAQFGAHQPIEQKSLPLVEALRESSGALP